MRDNQFVNEATDFYDVTFGMVEGFFCDAISEFVQELDEDCCLRWGTEKLAEHKLGEQVG